MQVQDRVGGKQDGVGEGNLVSRGGFRTTVGADLPERSIGKREDVRIRIPSENPLFLTEGIVDAPVVLVYIAAGAITVGEVAVSIGGNVRFRKESLHHIGRSGVDPARGNDVGSAVVCELGAARAGVTPRAVR